MRLKNLTFRTKLLLAFVLTAAVTTIVGGVGFMCFQRVSSALEQLVRVDVPATTTMANADMYHDGLRAVVMTALFEAERKDAAHEQHVRQELADFTNHLTEDLEIVDQLSLNAEAKAAIQAVRPDLDRYAASANRIVDAAFEDRTAATALLPEFTEAFEQLESSLEGLSDLLKAHADAAAQRGTSAAAAGARTLIVSIVVGALLAMGLGFAFSRTLLSTLIPLVDALEKNAAETSASATELAAASQSLAEGASRNAAALQESGAALEEMASMTKRNAASTATGKELSAQARGAAGEGLGRLDEMGQTIAGIKCAVADMQTAVSEMQSSGEEVAKIIKTIDEIAFQTNLLALNAAIEAARAGEAGMGFAVVADEVRVLAQRSAQAAKDTAEKIQTSLKRSEHGAHASEAVVKNLAGVETTAEKVQRGFEAIVTQITSLDEVIAEVAAASQEQSHGIDEVTRAVSEMDKLSQASAASAEENAGAAHELTSRSASLREVVGVLQQLVGMPATGRTSSAPPSAVPPPGGHRPAVRIAWQTPAENRATPAHSLS